MIDPNASLYGRVNTLGQVAVQFHCSTRRLKYFFETAQLDSVYRPAKCPKVRKGSTAFVDEKSKVYPTPRLNIAIHICGSRGDVQPFIPIAKLLQAPPHNHRVRICTHPAFKDFVESNGIEFFSIGGDPEALMAYMVKNPGLLPNMESIKAGDIGKRRKEMGEIIEGTWRSCIEAGNGMGEKTTALNVDAAEDLFIADAIIANPPSMGHIHCAEKLGIPLHIVFTMPWSPTKAFHHPLASMEYGETDRSMANYFSFSIMELLTWQGLGDVINRFRTHTLNLDSISPLWGHQLISRLKVPHSYLWSQALIPKPADWGPHLSVTGFSFLKAGSDYAPPQDLADFLAAGPPPVYIGFGSIVVADPTALTKLIFEAVKQAGVRAIVSKGWGGVGAGDVPDNVYLIGNCPHDWLFQRVSCVVHHGGAGTTAIGIALGKPTVVVPFFGDQPFWGQMIAKRNAGPVPVPFKQMTAESLAASIKFALKDDVKESVQEMAASIAEEDGAGGAAADFEEKLNLHDMRCHLCPERLAVWKDKKTGAHLSGFAAYILGEKQLIATKDLRLLHHRHWYTHEGAEAPAFGLVATVSGLFSGLATDTKDFSQRLKKQPKAQDVENSPPTTPHKSHIKKPGERLSSHNFHNMAWRMARKTFDEDMECNFRSPPTDRGLANVRARLAKRKARGGRAVQITSATARYVGDVTGTLAQTPVALFYNLANGFRNIPSYTIRNEIPRRRDDIKGIGSGVVLAGKEFTLNFYESFESLVRHPYLGAKEEGVLGFGKGLGRGFGAMFFHGMAAVFALPGYTLKGIEKEFSRRRLGALQAEIYLIRLRQAWAEFNQTDEEARAEVVERWEALVKEVGRY